jgi:hypothetical protein
LEFSIFLITSSAISPSNCKVSNSVSLPILELNVCVETPYTGKKAKYGTPKGCTTGILEDSEELQAIIKKDWKKLEQLNKKQHCNKTATNRSPSYFFCINEVKVI